MADGPATLILVDDDEDDALMLRAAADRGAIGVRIIHLDRGEGLIEALARNELPANSIVLLDLNMPRMDGFTVLSRLPVGSPPVVVYSTSSDRIQVDRAYAAGANAYLTKPNSLAKTVEVLATLVSHWFIHGRVPGVPA